MVFNYKSLSFYIDAHELTKEIYKITKEFPKEELYDAFNSAPTLFAICKFL